MLKQIIYNLLIYIITIIPLLIAVAYFTLIELHVLAAIQRRQVGFSAIFKIANICLNTKMLKKTRFFFN